MGPIFVLARSAKSTLVKKKIILQSRAFSEAIGNIKTGFKSHGFQVEKVDRIEELEILTIKSKHIKTGAEHLHLSKDDACNVFAIGFNTIPSDDSGIAHILEHTTLCGSKKYPIHDPFFKMRKRSLVKYMNAMTAPDHTIYPFSTTNLADMKNLRSVYLDAVLFPLLRRNDFAQEGWRLERENVDDETSPLTFKGVVYNEMKGYVSDTSYCFYLNFCKLFYDGTTYSHDSGGNPNSITSLKHKKLLDFHRVFYHPSNSKTVTYGDGDIFDHWKDLDLNFSQFENLESHHHESKILKPWYETRRVEANGPIDSLLPPKEQFKQSVSWLLPHNPNHYTKFVGEFISFLLLSGHASPFYKELIESKLGADFSPNTGIDTNNANFVFTVGLQGVEEKNIEKVIKIIDEVLQKCAENGFPLNRIESLIHELEISLKHTTSSTGLYLSKMILSKWFNDDNPINVLKQNSMLERLKRDLRDANFLKNFINENFVQNKSRFEFLMKPSENFASQIVQEENSRLSSQVEKLTSHDILKIDDQSRALKQNQENQEDLSILPSLTIKDIRKYEDTPKLEHRKFDCGSKVTWLLKGKDVTYLRILSNLDHIPDSLRKYLPLYTECLRHLGLKNLPIQELDEKIRRFAGKIEFSSLLINDQNTLDGYNRNLIVSSYCLDHNVAEMVQLIEDMIFNVDFDALTNLQTLIRVSASNAVNSIVDSGHSYAMLYASQFISPICKETEESLGLSQVSLLKELSKKKDLSMLIAKLKEIHKYAFRTDSKFFITCNKSNLNEANKAVEKFASKLESLDKISKLLVEPEKFEPVRGSHQFIEMPLNVSFTAISLRTFPYIRPKNSKFQVLTSFLEPYLHKEIREKGGAYGSGFKYSSLKGVANFFTYRDPTPLDSIKAFKRGFLKAFENVNDSDLLEAKLAIFQKLDAPKAISEQGVIEFFDNIDSETKHVKRQEILNTTLQDIKELAHDCYLNYLNDAGYVVIGQNSDNDSYENWNISRVLKNSIYQ